MAHFGNIFNSLIEISGLPMEEIANRLGFQLTYLYKLRRKASVDMELLDKVCRVFCVNPMIFFDEDILKNGIPSTAPVYKNHAILGHATMNIGMYGEIDNLKEQLKSKDRELAEKERFIQFLLSEKQTNSGVSL